MNRIAIAALLGALGCRAPAPAAGRGDGGAPADARVVLYRDGALVEEVHRLAIDADGVAVLPIAGDVASAAGLQVGSPDAEIVEWSRQPAAATGDDVTVRAGAREVRGRALAGAPGGPQVVASSDGVHLVAGEVVAGGQAAVLRIVTRGARGQVTVELRYPTDHLRWHTAYTLVEDRRGRGRLHGALALDNRTGRQWERARFALIDRDRPIAIPNGLPEERFLIRIPGRFAVTAGEQRLDLGLPDAAVALAATLVYDPVGTSLDGGQMMPLGDPAYGVADWPARVDESVLLDVARISRDPLPAGDVRMFQVADDGRLVWRGEGKLLPPAEGAEARTAIAVGQADGVSGRRTRTMFERDDDRSRIVEEIKLELTNHRDRAVAVLAREHLYRGKCWTLAYHSTGDRIAKEGEQQVALGIDVPARGQATIVYRVVYQWDQAQCTPSKSEP